MPLLDFWTRFPSRGVHPEDLPHLPVDAHVLWDSVATARKFATEMEDLRSPLRRQLHLGLFPQPFVGDVLNASVYVLFGNPGLSINDYVDELENEAYVHYCEDNLRGKVDGFGPLMPAAQGTGAAGYWEPVFARLIREVAAELGLAHADGRAWVVSQIATIEAGAYHSMNFPVAGFAALPSTRAAVTFVRQRLVARAQSGDCVVFVWRQAKLWGLEQGNNILVRDPAMAQGRYLQDRERRAMVQFLAKRFRGPRGPE
jgi:hypothetical protein